MEEHDDADVREGTGTDTHRRGDDRHCGRARSPHTGEGESRRADVQTEFMVKRHNLPADQCTKVAAINLAYAQKARPILTGSEGTLRKMHALKDLESKKDAELNAVLTPQQFQTL
jgi:hypothetical protein